MNSNLKTKLIEEYKKIFINTFESGGGYGFRFYHGLRIMKYCEQFLKLPYFKNKKINKDAVLVAALFHDIGKVMAINKSGEIDYDSHGNQNHAEIGGTLIPKYLSMYIKDEKLIALIARIVDEQHGKDQTSIEAKLVKDADRFDNYGFIQIWRNITHAHYDKKNIDGILEFWHGGAQEYAKERLAKFNFPAIKKLAAKRFKKMNYLFAEIDRECEGKDIN